MMHAQGARFDVPKDLTGFVHNKRVHIRADIDTMFRRALREAVARDGSRKAWRLIVQSLDNGPSSKGYIETVQYFGNELDAKLRITAQIVDGLEIAVPGFKKWLEVTGFGNDKTMTRGFVAWAEHKSGVGNVISGLRDG
jgi:hypothetical protein